MDQFGDPECPVCTTLLEYPPTVLYPNWWCPNCEGFRLPTAPQPPELFSVGDQVALRFSPRITYTGAVVEGPNPDGEYLL